MGTITEIVWPLFRRDQMYDTDIPSVRIDFGRDGIHLIKPKSIQFPALRNYGTIDRFAKGQAYVALSRVGSLDGLRIAELDCSKLTGKTPCNEEDALKEMERMRQLGPHVP